MTKMLRIAALLAALAVAVLVPAAVAGHGKTVKVRGECCAGGSNDITGDLQGTLKWTDDGFGILLSTLKYDQKRGILKFEFTQVFDGTIDGRKVKFYTRDKSTQRVIPGTPLYDFSTFPSDQPGTTGDRDRWLGGSGTSRIVPGPDGLKGVSGKLRWHSIAFLGRASYKGKVKLPS
jgi:hypothetical protein